MRAAHPAAGRTAPPRWPEWPIKTATAAGRRRSPGRAWRTRHPGDGHGDEHRRGDDVGLHRRVAHHQPHPKWRRWPRWAGQAQPRLLEHLKGQEHDEHLEHRGEGHLLLGGHNGQGQLHGDGLRVEGDQGDIQPRHQDGHKGAQPPDHIQGGGRHPVEGPVLAGFEKLVDGAGQHPGEGRPSAISPTRPSSRAWQNRSGRWV